MKKATYSDQEIISAGKTLMAAGKNVTAFAIRKMIKGGNAQRIRDVWAQHLREKSEHVSVSEVEFPREMLEVAYSGEREHLFRPNVNTDSGST